MRRARVAVSALILTIGWTLTASAQPVPAPPSRTQVTIDRSGGLITVTFDVDGRVTLLFLPEDLVAGERFTGRLDPEPHEGWNPTFIEAGGQRAEIAKPFTWTVPPADAAGNVEFVLRGARPGTREETELARVAIRLMTAAPHDEVPLGVVPNEFVIPATGQIGAPFTIAGPFDGDGTHTALTVHGTAAVLVAETKRHAIFHLPAEHTGQSSYRFSHDGQTREGRVRAVRIATTYPRHVAYPKVGQFAMTVTGLEDLRDDLVVAFSSRRVDFKAAKYGDPNWLYITPADVRAGTYTWKHGFMGIGYSTLPNEISATLVSPVTRDEQLTLILWDPRRRDWHRSPYEEKAAALRPFLPDSRDALIAYWKAHGLSYRVYEVLTELDADGAAADILGPVESMTDNQAGAAAIQFYTNRVMANPSLGYRGLVHDAAVRLLTVHDRTQPYATCCVDTSAAVYALGTLGDPADIPFLEGLYERGDHDAAEAALMRLGVEKYIAHTRDVLAAPLPTPFTAEDAFSISLALRRAGFSRRRELVPVICPHLHTPGFGESDVTVVSPSSDATMALLAILGRWPTPDDCRTPGARHAR